MMEEEGAIIAGLLVGLNVIDANFCMKGEDLDSQVWENSPITTNGVTLCLVSSGLVLIKSHQPSWKTL